MLPYLLLIEYFRIWRFIANCSGFQQSEPDALLNGVMCPESSLFDVAGILLFSNAIAGHLIIVNILIDLLSLHPDPLSGVSAYGIEEEFWFAGGLTDKIIAFHSESPIWSNVTPALRAWLFKTDHRNV